MLDRKLIIEITRITEAAAIAASGVRGRGDERGADKMAVDAMLEALNDTDMKGVIVVGEGVKGEAEKLFIGEKVGSGKGAGLDIAVDPLEGSTMVAKSVSNALSVMAMAETGSLLKVPDCYMEKIAVGPDLPEGIVDLDRTPAENLNALASARGVDVSGLTVCILDRPRHGKLIAAVREAGAAINLIRDGDIAGVIHTALPVETGIDIYMGTGGAPEGVLAATALKCIGGQMQGRLLLDNPQMRQNAYDLGLEDPFAKFTLDEMVAGDVMFAATGVTGGTMLKGVKVNRKAKSIISETIVMRSSSGTVRWINNQRRLSS